MWGVEERNGHEPNVHCTYVANVAVPHGSEEFDAVLETVAFACLKQVVQFWAVAAWLV